MLVDSHAHLNFPELLADIDSVLARAKAAGVEKIINIGTSLADSKTAIELAQKYDNLYATVGIHPEGTETDWDRFEQLAKSPKVVAIGECGLDNKVGLPNQREIFLKQIEIAKKLDLPLSIHIRDAQDDLMTLPLGGVRGVFHCFSGDEKYLKWTQELGFYISFAGNITFKNAEGLRDLARLVPLDRLLVETDCPFLAPDPVRGSRNEPANVKIIALRLAEVKNVSFEELAARTTENAEKLFGI